MMASAQVYDQGYAVMVYDLSTDKMTFQYRDETFQVEKRPTKYYHGWQVVKVEELRGA